MNEYASLCEARSIELISLKEASGEAEEVKGRRIIKRWGGGGRKENDCPDNVRSGRGEEEEKDEEEVMKTHMVGEM